MKKDLYRLEKEESLEEIAVFLERVATDLRKGKVNLTEGEMETSLDLPQSVTLDIDVDQHVNDLTSTSVEIELKWKE